MTDRELLELAAMAAGMDCRMRYCDAWKGMALYTPQDGYYGPTWNPLTDDGDALRLAVKLHIDLDQYADRVRCCKSCDFDDSEDTDAWEPLDGAPYAATRRAIVRAAAEIGKGM